MLRNLNPLLSPELLYTLALMGHGDEIAIVDANFPAESKAQRVVRLDGIDAPEVLVAILSVMPLDFYTDVAAHTMQMVDKPDETPPVVKIFHEKINTETAGRVTKFCRP